MKDIAAFVIVLLTVTWFMISHDKKPLTQDAKGAVVVWKDESFVWGKWLDYKRTDGTYGHTYPVMDEFFYHYQVGDTIK